MSRPYQLYIRTFFLLLLNVVKLYSFAQQTGANTTAKKDTVLLAKLLNKGVASVNSGSSEAPAYLLQAVKIAEKNTDGYSIKQTERALAGLGSYYTFRGNHDSSAFFYNKLLKRGQARNDAYAIATANLGFGLIADYQADYLKAISHNMDALQFFEHNKDTLKSASIMNNIANTYIRLKQYQKAADLLLKALNVYQKKGINRLTANTMSNLARAYKGLGNRTKELELKLKAYAMFKADNYKKGMATVCINLGVFYEDSKNPEEALKYYQLALQYSREIQDKGNIAILFNNMAQFYLKRGKTSLALEYVDSAWYYASRNGNKLSQSDALLYRACILHTLGQHEEAETFMDRYIRMNDSIYNVRMQRQVAEMDVKYETGKKENQIALLNKQNNIKSLQIKNNLLLINQNNLQMDKQRQALVIDSLKLKNKDQLLANQQLDAEQKEQRITSLKEESRMQSLSLKNRQLQLTQRNYIIAFILTLLIAGAALSYLYYSRYKTKQDNRIRLEILKQQEIATQSLFEGEQNERIRIARDLHDSIGQMLAVIKMNVGGAEGQEHTTALVNQAIKEVRYISHNLIPETLNFGLFAALEDLCEKVSAGGKAVVAIDIPAGASTHRFEKANELSIYRIVQEVLSNMVKHAQATHIQLNVLLRDSNIILDIKDNGQGFDTAGISESKGIGWKNIAARVNLLNGNMQVQSEKLSGTQIEISIPQK